MFVDKDLESKIQERFTAGSRVFTWDRSRKLYAKSCGKWTASIISAFGPLRDCILVSDQLLLRPLFPVPEVVVYESFDCIITINDQQYYKYQYYLTVDADKAIISITVDFQSFIVFRAQVLVLFFLFVNAIGLKFFFSL